MKLYLVCFDDWRGQEHYKLVKAFTAKDAIRKVKERYKNCENVEICNL